MVVKKANKKVEKKVTKASKPVKKKVEEEEGLSLDDAFGDDEGVEYAESKPRKEKKKVEEEEDVDDEEEDKVLENDLDEEMDRIERGTGELSAEQPDYTIKASKPIAKVKKGDKIKIDGKEYEVDAHYVLIDHKSTKEMALEVFDPASDKDYQLRYFDDQVESTMELYELQEILYVKRLFKKIEW